MDKEDIVKAIDRLREDEEMGWMDNVHIQRLMTLGHSKCDREKNLN